MNLKSWETWHRYFNSGHHGPTWRPEGFQRHLDRVSPGYRIIFQMSSHPMIHWLVVLLSGAVLNYYLQTVTLSAANCTHYSYFFKWRDGTTRKYNCHSISLSFSCMTILHYPGSVLFFWLAFSSNVWPVLHNLPLLHAQPTTIDCYG